MIGEMVDWVGVVIPIGGGAVTVVGGVSHEVDHAIDLVVCVLRGVQEIGVDVQRRLMTPGAQLLGDRVGSVVLVHGDGLVRRGGRRSEHRSHEQHDQQAEQEGASRVPGQSHVASPSGSLMPQIIVTAHRVDQGPSLPSRDIPKINSAMPCAVSCPLDGPPLRSIRIKCDDSPKLTRKAPRGLTPAIGILFLLLALLCGCMSGANRFSRGAVGPVGSPLRGMVQLTDSGEATLNIQGQVVGVVASSPVLDQLQRIPGAYIEVRGRAGQDSVRVRAFEILDAGDGLRPMVGVLVVDQSGVSLSDDVTGTRLTLRGTALADLKSLHRARVWVTGTVVGPRIILVAHWGLLVPP